MNSIIRFFISSLFLLFTLFGTSQESRVSWSVEVDESGDDSYIVIKGKTIEGWHIYTTNPPDELGGPMPTVIEFEKSDNYELVGKIKEHKVEVHVNEIGDKEGVFVNNPGIFKQKIRRLSDKSFSVPIFIEYQVCDASKCEFSQGNVIAKFGVNTDSETIENVSKQEETDTLSSVVNLGNSDEGGIEWRLTGNDIGSGVYQLNFSPNQDVVLGKLPLVSQAETVSKPPINFLDSVVFSDKNMVIDSGGFVSLFCKTYGDSILNGKFEFQSVQDGQSYNAAQGDFEVNLHSFNSLGSSKKHSESYWKIFLIAFFSGFAALLTPCVFPMIPMTVSFFTKQSKNKAVGIKNAVIYGLSIIVIYVGLGLFVSGVFGSDALNALSTNVWFNVFFFFLLVIFGLSFLGAFEIRLPSSWTNKADKNADKGGLIGIFFMAFTLALVSFSCTGPIIGTLLVEAASQGGLSPFFGMLGFSLALALPFGLFAAFPGWMNSLPQSGGWLNSVKVVLGLLEIAFAFKFLSNADLVVQGHWLERETFLSIWIVLFSIMGFYLLGKLKFPHDSDIKHVSIPRFGIAVITFTLVIYMIPGLWGAPLKWISGFPPPLSYSESPYGINGHAPQSEGLPEGAHMDAHGILLFDDLEPAIKYANETGKPLMKDFTGYACVNCRKMEENVWYDDRILPYLRDSLVVVSLHVDDKTLLPENQQMTMEDGYRIRSVGNKWSYHQRTIYAAQSQPQYFLLDNNNIRLGPQADYENHGEAELFKTWLDFNLNEFRARKNAIIINTGLAKI